MALSLELQNAGLTAESIDAEAAVSLEQVEGGFAITKIHLQVEAKVPGATRKPSRRRRKRPRRAARSRRYWTRKSPWTRGWS